MKQPTSFDLDYSIRLWLKIFRKYNAFDDATVREMELHLRDHIDDLLSKGYSPQTAFEEAVDEFGTIPGMAKEELLNLKPASSSSLGSHFQLLRNYGRVAVRNFTRQPFLTLLNSFGLAIGITGALLIALYINDELSYDQMFADSERIYRINIENQTSGEYSEYASAPGPMAGVIVQDCPGIEAVTRFREVGSVLIKKTGADLNVKEDHVVAVDSSFFEMFGITMLEGDPSTALEESNSVVLTKSAAQNQFGTASAMGQSLIVDNNETYVVTGVIEDLPANSFLRNYTAFLSLTSFGDYNTDGWNTWYFPTFVKIHPDSEVNELQSFLNKVKDNYLIPWAATFIPGLTVESSRKSEEETGDFMRFNTTALTDIHLYSGNREGEFNINSDIKNVYVLGIIGVFLIVMACVNFMNLSTAYSLKRAREVGIRKTLGSGRISLIRQFLTESTIVTFLSLVLALGLTLIILPYFNALSNKQIILPVFDLRFWLIILVATIVIGLLSGSYPALFMSRFAPTQMLKSAVNNVGGKGVRNLLVIVQFSISIFLIVATLVVYQQISFIQNKDLGFEKDQVLVIQDVDAAGEQLKSFKEEIRQISKVKHVSLSSYLPTPSSRAGITFFAEGSFLGTEMKPEMALIIENWDVDENYISTLGLKVLAGRDFNPDNPADSNALIINETTVEMMGVSPEEVIGMRLTDDFRRPDKENMEYRPIIGVVQNFHFETMRNRIDAVSFSLGGNPTRMMVKLESGYFAQPIEEIGSRWKKLAPGQPFDYYFMDDSFNETYLAELRLGRIFIAFTQLSIFIACLGLLGLAAFSAERRSKEIGIKKVLGASVNLITFQLSRDFLKLVLIAVVIALPLGWLAMNRWLQEFVFRIEISWWVLGLAALIAILIALLTVGYHSIKAAIMNPAKSLRSE